MLITYQICVFRKVFSHLLFKSITFPAAKESVCVPGSPSESLSLHIYLHQMSVLQVPYLEMGFS